VLWLVLLAFAATLWGVAMIPDHARGLAEAFEIPEAMAEGVVELAQAVGADPWHLAAVIRYETAGTWDPGIYHPSGEAVGWFQFRESTATRLGTTLQDLAGMTWQDQMNWCRAYLERIKRGDWPDPRPGHRGELLEAGPLNTFQAVAMAVFYGPARYSDPWKAFQDPPISDPRVEEHNPGIATPADYLIRVLQYGGGAVGPLAPLLSQLQGGRP